MRYVLIVALGGMDILVYLRLALCLNHLSKVTTCNVGKTNIYMQADHDIILQ